MSDDQDLLVLVDDDDQAVGTATKLDTHLRGALHRAFSVIVWDSAKRLLLQKRQAGKYHSGGLWTNACCGHPRPGEDVAAAALRRLEEEMGFACELTNLGTMRYRAALDHSLTEHEIVHVFRGAMTAPWRPTRRRPTAINGRGSRTSRPMSPPCRGGSASGSVNMSRRNGRSRSSCLTTPAEASAAQAALRADQAKPAFAMT